MKLYVFLVVDEENTIPEYYSMYIWSSFMTYPGIMVNADRLPDIALIPSEEASQCWVDYSINID